MSVFAGAKQKGRVPKKEQLTINNDNKLGSKLAAIKSVFEHIGLYIGLACYTALGAKERYSTINLIVIFSFDLFNFWISILKLRMCTIKDWKKTVGHATLKIIWT